MYIFLNIEITDANPIIKTKDWMKRHKSQLVIYLVILCNVIQKAK